MKIYGTQKTVQFEPEIVVIAGFTGKDRKTTEAHIKELSEEGVPVPETIPSFYRIQNDLVTHEDSIRVMSRESSGEVEPVLFVISGKWYIGIGSDHTARDLERTGIAESKAACRKPVHSEVLEFDYVEKNWEKFILRSSVAIEGTVKKYQDGQLLQIIPVRNIVSDLEKNLGVKLHNSVVFLGTIPILEGKFVYGNAYHMEMENPEDGVQLSFKYSVKTME